MSSIIGGDIEIQLDEWLDHYIGKDQAENGCITVIDLSRSFRTSPANPAR
jgi:hypothetical protein